MTFEAVVSVDYEGTISGEEAVIKCFHHEHFEDAAQMTYAIQNCIMWVSRIFERPTFMDGSSRLLVSMPDGQMLRVGMVAFFELRDPHRNGLDGDPGVGPLRP